jgi:hypothetical protein
VTNITESELFSFQQTDKGVSYAADATLLVPSFGVGPFSSAGSIGCQVETEVKEPISSLIH